MTSVISWYNEYRCTDTPATDCDVFWFDLAHHTHKQIVCNFSTGDSHDDVIKWKHFPRNWPFVREIHRSPVNFPHKGQWRGALMFSLIYAWINDWVNNREAGDLRYQHGHYDVIVMGTANGTVSSMNVDHVHFTGLIGSVNWKWRLLDYEMI